MINLNEIVSGPVTRRKLEIYLNQFPTSKHPFDQQRLDHFIIALHKYRSNFSLSKLEEYLKKDLNWDEEDINWCVTRISIGLEILKSRQNFE